MFTPEESALTISELKVMHSAAGYYIGRTCEDSEMPGLEEPYSRESGYFKERIDAAAALGFDSFEVRNCVENELAYDSGIIPRPKR